MLLPPVTNRVKYCLLFGVPGLINALTMTNSKKVGAKIQPILPRRKTNKNRPPSILTVTTDEKVERWWFPTPVKQLSEEGKILVVGCITQQLVKLVFDNHYYYWEGGHI